MRSKILVFSTFWDILLPALRGDTFSTKTPKTQINPNIALTRNFNKFRARTKFGNLVAFDLPIPNWLSATFGGFWRMRVRLQPPQSAAPSGVHRVEYVCELPLLPARLLVRLDTAVADGDCAEVNALRLRPELLLKRTVVRVGLEDHVAADVTPDGNVAMGAAHDMATVYCNASVQAEAAGLLGVLAWAALPFQRVLQAHMQYVAREFLEEHWRAVLHRWSTGDVSPVDDGGGQPEITRKVSKASFVGLGASAGPPQVPSTSPGSEEASGGAAGPITSGIHSQGSVPDSEVADQTPKASHEVTKGSFSKGFLYKLGDGLLNTTWNLRYFLLIGPTLQYFRSPHEAKPRDVIDLRDASVQWAKDQSRPFAFSVETTNHRILYLSGNDDKETCGWIDRIRTASKLTETHETRNVGSSSAYRRPALLGAGFPKAPAVVEDPGIEGAFRVCAQALVQASCGEGFRLQEVQNGLRIFVRADGDAGDASAGGCSVVGAWLVLTLLVLSFALSLAPATTTRLLGDISKATPNAFLVPCLVLCAAVLWRWCFSTSRLPAAPPMLYATARVDCPAEELRDIVEEPSFYAEWRPGHLHGRLLSLLPGKDDILYNCFRLEFGGLFSTRAHLHARRRWIRAHDGMRLLCTVAEACSDSGLSTVGGCEGFAVVPNEDNSCTAVWLCGLRLAQWAPSWAQERLAIQRVSALAGLRDWIACKQHVSLGAAGAVSCDAPQGRESLHATVFRGFQCAASGGLHAPGDLERAVCMSEVMLRAGTELLRGGRLVKVQPVPHGLTQAGHNLAQRYASRWAYAPLFLPAASTTERARERLLLVVAFAVAGLHLAAISFPHLPWIPIAPGQKHTLLLPDNGRIRVEQAPEASAVAGLSAAPSLRRSIFEVLSGSGAGYRIHGTDEVTCHTELPGELRFADRGMTTVELAPGSSITFTLPELRIRPSSWSLGRGSVYEWLGSAHFVDTSGNLQCDLCFGSSSELEASDAVSGTLRDAVGLEIGRIRGSWLGPLLCNNEVIWRGPRLQPPPY